MRKITTILSLVFIIHVSVFGQIEGDTIFFGNKEIRVYTYILQNDTIVKAYFDKNIPRIMGKRKTNMGKMKYDLTFDSITTYVRKLYNSASITSTDFQNVKLTKYKKEIQPNFNSAISTDCYWISAINYYTEKIIEDSLNYLNYYELALAFDSYNISYSLQHSKTIQLLNSCLRLNSNFEKALLLKAKVHEKIGKMNGIMMSEPDHLFVDKDEIKLAIQCVDELLKINPTNSEAIEYRVELINKYK